MARLNQEEQRALEKLQELLGLEPKIIGLQQTLVIARIRLERMYEESDDAERQKKSR